MAGIGLDAGEFLATYSQVMRIVPTRYLPWHGRTTPASATVQIDPRRGAPARRAAPGLPQHAPARHRAARSRRVRSVARVDAASFGLLAITWGSSYIAIKIGGQSMGPFALVAFRLAAAAGLLLVIAAITAGEARRRATAGRRSSWCR